MISQDEKRKRLIQNIVLFVIAYLIYATNKDMHPSVFGILAIALFLIGFWNQLIRGRDWEDYDDE